MSLQQTFIEQVDCSLIFEKELCRGSVYVDLLVSEQSDLIDGLPQERLIEPAYKVVLVGIVHYLDKPMRLQELD